MTSIALVISIAANYLLFLWIFWMLPRHKPRKKALFRGTLLAAIGFEVIKFVMTMTLPRLATSPSGAAFGSVIGLMAFFYFFARLTLFVAAWIATAQYKDDPRMPDSKERAAKKKAATVNDSEFTQDHIIVPDDIHIADVNAENEIKRQ